MRLIDYLVLGYNIVTSRCMGKKIKDSYPGVLIFTDNAFDGIPHGNLLVDSYYRSHPAVLRAEPYQDSFVVENFTNEFVGKEMGLPLTGESIRKSIEQLEKELADQPSTSDTNILEIVLKDTDSVPEVWYKGEKIEGLFDITYHYHTTTDRVDGSANDINIEYFDKVDKFPDKKIIGHKREV